MFTTNTNNSEKSKENKTKPKKQNKETKTDKKKKKNSYKLIKNMLHRKKKHCFNVEKIHCRKTHCSVGLGTEKWKK